MNFCTDKLSLICHCVQSVHLLQTSDTVVNNPLVTAMLRRYIDQGKISLNEVKDKAVMTYIGGEINAIGVFAELLYVVSAMGFRHTGKRWVEDTSDPPEYTIGQLFSTSWNCPTSCESAANDIIAGNDLPGPVRTGIILINGNTMVIRVPIVPTSCQCITRHRKAWNAPLADPPYLRQGSDSQVEDWQRHYDVVWGLVNDGCARPTTPSERTSCENLNKMFGHPVRKVGSSFQCEPVDVPILPLMKHLFQGQLGVNMEWDPTTQRWVASGEGSVCTIYRFSGMCASEVIPLLRSHVGHPLATGIFSTTDSVTVVRVPRPLHRKHI